MNHSLKQTWERCLRAGDRYFMPVPELNLPLERLGREEGAWEFWPAPLGARSIVYCFGVGEDLSFELQLIEKFGLQVFAFDPTPKAVDWVERQSLPSGLHFKALGIDAHDGERSFYPPRNSRHVSFTVNPNQGVGAPITLPVHRLSTLAQELGHHRIDLLKLDIEGSEYAVVEDILKSGLDVRQWLIEFHHRFYPGGRRKTREVIRKLRANGFWNVGRSSHCEEYTFIKF